MTTMIAEPPTSRSLGVGFNSSRNRAGNPEAWKQHIGTKPVPARLALLPDAKPNWHRVGVSAVLQIAILTFFILIPVLYPQQMKTAIQYSQTESAAASHLHQPCGSQEIAAQDRKAGCQRTRYDAEVRSGENRRKRERPQASQR